MKNFIDKTFRQKIEQSLGLPPETSWTPEKGWKDYEKQYNPKVSEWKRFFMYISSAAALILLILVIYNKRSEGKLISNTSDKIQEIVLPDNNRIILNRRSSVEYHLRTSTKQSEFSIKGEAYFEIADLHNIHYAIKANNAVIIVENPASLNVRARENEDNANITVTSGAVKLLNELPENGLALLVTEGNYCSVHKSQNLAYVSANTNDNCLAWMTGKLVFKSIPIATVTDILTEYYNVSFELENKQLAYCLFTGTFEKDPFNKVLNKIRTELDVKITDTGNKIKISGKGCL